MVELESVSFHYGREDAGMLLTGVEDISFKIEKGQCAVLCGRSGAGKSTILHLISGLVPGFYEGQLKGRVIVNNGFPSSSLIFLSFNPFEPLLAGITAKLRILLLSALNVYYVYLNLHLTS